MKICIHYTYKIVQIIASNLLIIRLFFHDQFWYCDGPLKAYVDDNLSLFASGIEVNSGASEKILRNFFRTFANFHRLVLSFKYSLLKNKLCF